MREYGVGATPGQGTHEKFQEMKHLEKSIGETGVLAMRPFLQIERKDLWQMNVFE